MSPLLRETGRMPVVYARGANPLSWGFISSLLSEIRMVSSAYLRLLVFLQAIMIPACASSSLAFCMMYFAYKLNKQGDNIQP